MVKLKVLCGCSVQFLAEATLTTSLDELLLELTDVYNGILIVRLTALEIENFVKRLDDGPRNPAATQEAATSPDLEPSKILVKVTEEALARVSNAQLECGKYVTRALIESTKDMLKATLSAVALPEAAQKERNVLMRLDERNVEGSLSHDDAKLWWAGRELRRGNELRIYFGSNEKTTVTVTLSSHPPTREKTAAEMQFNEYLLSRAKRQQDFEDLEPDDDESAALGIDSLRKSVHGLLDIKWKP